MIQVYADSGFLSKGTGLLCVALCCSYVPASGKILRRCLGDEVADDLSGRRLEVRGQLFELLPRRIIQPQHEARAIGAGVMLRLMGCFILCYTTRVICKGELTMEEIVFSLKHYWRFVDSEALELQGLSWDREPKAA
jgi:hypothetical protein